MHCAAPMQIRHVPASCPQAWSLVPLKHCRWPPSPKPQHPRHELESHTHWPIEHLSPTGHCTAVFPHTHELNALHRSARVGSHATHVEPFGPHAITVRVVWHVPFWQQPCGQFCELHVEQTPASHWPELPQFAHGFPKRPHCIDDIWLAVTHTFPTQQPAQFPALHTHWPNRQSDPVGHAGPLPHAHCPCALHESARSGSQRTHAEPAVPHADSER